MQKTSKVLALLFVSPALVLACATEEAGADWDCREVNVPLGRTTECSSAVKSGLTDDGPVADGPAYVCPLGVADSDCPPSEASTASTSFGSLAPQSDDRPAGDGFYCTKEEGTRTCRKAPTCAAGAHREQMDCEPDQSSGLGVGASLGASGPHAGYPGAGGGDHSMPGAQMECFYPIGAPPGKTTPAATFEYTLETVASTTQLRTRLTFSPHFVDNSYGTASIGWSKQHRFAELVGSNHAELTFYDKASTEKLHFKMDYISKSATAPSGYACLGVTGGEGRMILGDATSITKTLSSLDRNLNERGYPQFIVDSPASDTTFAPPAAAPKWDFRVVYEAWIKAEAFGAGGFGKVKLAFVHASPSKANSNTLPVESGACPPNWAVPPSSPPGSGSDPRDGESCQGASDNPDQCPPAADVLK